MENHIEDELLAPIVRVYAGESEFSPTRIILGIELDASSPCLT
jgi:hypothetical protein